MIKPGDRIKFDLPKSFGMRRRYSLKCDNGYTLIGPANLIVLDTISSLSLAGIYYKIFFLNEDDGVVGCSNFLVDEFIVIS